MPRDNLSIVLAERPTGDIIPGQTFHQKVTPAPTAADLKDGEILVEALYLSLDPAMRSWLNDVRSYVPPVAIGEVMRGASACRVLASKSEKAKVGDYVYSDLGWTEYAILRDGKFTTADAYPGLQDPKDILSALGMTGLTAWYGMTQIGDPKPGELVVVSGAAGATGSVAAQIAKLKGARVVGICGSDDKAKWLVDELGLDAALNYKDADYARKFTEATKGFIDVYFDNVGGETLELALKQAKEHARFVMCGMISQYNTDKPIGPRNIGRVITMRIKMQGFIIFDHAKLFVQARRELSGWIKEGKLKKTEHVLTGGLKVAEQGLVDLYKGINSGKLLVEIKNTNEAPSKL